MRLIPAILFCAIVDLAAGATLFDDDTVLHVDLAGPLGATIADREMRQGRPFLLTADGVPHRVNVRVRGNSRARVCKFPPLRITFGNVGPRAPVFEGEQALRLVTHCNDSDRAEKDLLEEYFAYRIFNLLSDVSFRVRLLKITYSDTDEAAGSASREHYGFVIEPTARLAARVGGSAVQPEYVFRGALQLEQSAAVYIFQYLIGNTDWSLVASDGEDHCCHNGDLIDIDGEFHYVPYDFDLAGLVNASYARPDPSLRIGNVRQRLYRGMCLPDATVRTALAQIVSKRDEILTLLTALPVLSERDVARSTRYLDGFFRAAKDEDRLLGLFRRRCL